MFDKTEILKGLTEEQKIALVSDVFAASGDALNSAGVPHIEKTDLDALNALGGGRGTYPEFRSLATSWNLKLLSAAAGDAAAFVGPGSLVGMPPMFLRTGACATGLAEDPYLAAKITDAFVSAVDGAGGAACITGCGMRPVDAEYLDKEPQDNVFGNILSRAADAVLHTQKPTAAEITFARLKGEWKNANERLAQTAAEKSGARTVVAVDAPEELFRSKLTDPVWRFAGASSSALRSALKNYRRMKEDVEHGAIGADELDKAVKAGTAISAELLDAAAEKALDFVAYVAGKRVTRPVRSEAERIAGALFAATESIVMLKNSGGTLPLAKGCSVAVTGDADMAGMNDALESAVTAYGAKYAGFAAGYKLTSERNDELIPAVSELARQADAVVAFIGFGKKRFFAHESLALPANQAAALDAAVKSGKKVIAVIVGDVMPCMSFDGSVSAVLTLPTGGAQTVRGLFDVLFGAVSPSGKLTYTVYDDPDAYYSAQKQALASGKYKIGEFIGYRRYTTEKTAVKYPFGYGLSYGKFVYGNLKVTPEGVEITVKNTGSRTAAEIAQLYIGKKDSTLVRPARELKGFAKVMLEPGKTMQIKFPVSPAMLEVYDPADGKRKTESGVYEVYVGASSTDIRLNGTIVYSGEKIEKSADKLSDYLPSLSNILSDGYKMSEVAGEGGSFKSARPANVAVSYERLFEEEFCEDTGEDTELPEREEDDDILCFLDDSVTVKTAADGLIRFAAASGLKIDDGFAHELIAAFAASRMVLIKCDKPEFDVLITMLCEYFGCPNGIDDATAYVAPDDMFMNGRSALCGTLAFAASHRENIAISAFDGVRPDALGKVFVPFIRYAASPDDFKLTYGANKQSVDVAKNVWFVMRLADEKCAFPAYIADMASVIVPKTELTSVGGDSARVYAPNYYQMVAAFKRAERNHELDEPHWKKVDRFEKYVASHARFKADNKICVQMEKFIAVLLECGGSPAEALDGAVAAKLIPYAASALDGKLSSDDIGLVQTLDGIFGDDGAVKSKAVLRKLLSAKEGA